MRVLALASYPTEAAATRYRLEQFVVPLAERGIDMTIHPFLDSKLFARLYQRNGLPGTILGLFKSALLRSIEPLRARQADVVLVQREAMIFGPPLIEWLVTRVLRRPMVLDLDDATYVSYTSPTYGRGATIVKCPGKTDSLIRWARVVTCGNREIAEYATKKGAKTVVIPTVVDTSRFTPKAENQNGEPPVLGWIGTHSTYPFLESILPVLETLARTRQFRLKVVGAGRDEIPLARVAVENLEWRLEREIEDFQSFSIGLYPIRIGGSAPAEWAAGKSGFKGIQYMAVGIPFVTTPIGACAELGEPGSTHFSATSDEEWHDHLARLIDDADLRQRMGQAGREHALKYYSLPEQADKLARALYEAGASTSRN